VVVAEEEVPDADAEVEPVAIAPRARRRRRAKGGAAARAAQYWLVVSSPDNLRRTREHGFAGQGFKSRHRVRVESMQPGDRLLYYVTGRMAFAASATVTSPMYEDHAPIWRTDRREEDYPWRVRVKPDVVLEEPDWVLAKHLAFRLEYVKKWPPEHWTLALQGQLHQVPKVDFKLLEDELARVQKRGR
jgi:predicted RNA-binding protein